MKQDNQKIYRLAMRARGGWRIGKAQHTTLEEALQRRKYFINNGVKEENIKIVTDSELYN